MRTRLSLLARPTGRAQRNAFESHCYPKIIHHISECTSRSSAPVEEWACDPGSIFGGRNHKKDHHRTSRAFLMTIIAHPVKQACSHDMRKQAHFNLQGLRSLVRILQSGPEHDTEKTTITTSVDMSTAKYPTSTSTSKMTRYCNLHS